MDKKDLQNILKTRGLDYFKKLCYSYSNSFTHSCILDSCQLDSGVFKGKYEFLAAFGAEEVIQEFDENIDAAIANNWLFGILPYDLKNNFEKLESRNESFISNCELSLFIPINLITIDKSGELSIEKGQFDSGFAAEFNERTTSTLGLQKFNNTDQLQYLKKIANIKERIKKGDVYELNYCVQHQYTFEEFSPLQFLEKLLEKSPTPMASYFKWENIYLCGASMERFMAKIGQKVISQPIKGTIKKGKNKIEDEQLMTALYQSEKDRAENVMIVDLVRNDLAKICKTGSIEVNELFGIYSYLQLHQMISTISGNLNTESFYQILKATFPMGSMTGAPKISAMKSIDQLEDFKRDWYSGSIGYISPDNNFDFNVVIRSLICDSKHKKIAYSAGGAITIDSIAEQEWLECLLKTKAIESILID